MVEFTKKPSLFDPDDDSVFGLSWATSITDFLTDFPSARLVRDTGDTHCYILNDSPLEAEMELTVTFLFQLDALISVELRPVRLPAHSTARKQFLLLGERLTDLVAGTFTARDEGYHEVDDGTTRLGFDRLDLRLRLEDCR